MMNNRYVTVQRPEAALQRAVEFTAVGKEADALNALYEVIKDRRQRQWAETYEEIMMKFVELAVQLRNTALAKDGLFQYRVFTQQVSVPSLRNVVEKFLELAEAKTLEAQKNSIERVEEIDDLDAGDAPENLLLSVVSGDATQDRMDRTVLAPWMRFLWDSYRNCLDMLRNNTHVEEIYHWVARQSFSFCVRYQRRTEFRKLCELMRIHLAQIQKSQIATDLRHAELRVKLSNPESLLMLQETRLIQLNTAIEMELWQEAYKSAEDLHNIMMLTNKEKDRKLVKPQSYVNYYDKLALVFWKGGNVLFHAAALLQKFIIHKDMKKSFSDEEAVEQATRVLLATMSIPHGAESASLLTKLLDIEDQHVANIRVLSSLLRLPIAPTRVGLLKEIVRLNIPEMALEPVKRIYNLLEVKFAPLKLSANVRDGLAELEKSGRTEFNQYFEELKQVVATKVLRQLTVMYDNLSLERFEKIIPYYTRAELEHFLVQTTKLQSVKATISHKDKCVRFGTLDLSLAGGIESGLDIDSSSNGIEYIREHLSLLHNRLRAAVYRLDEPILRAQLEEDLTKQSSIYMHHRDDDYDRIIMRRRQIEAYKENNETQRREHLKRSREEAARRQEQVHAEELRRLEEQNKENERKRVQAERDDIMRRQKAEQLKRFQLNPIYQQIVKERGEAALMDMDPELVLKEQRERLDLERRENQNRLRLQEKKFDYMVRAFHLEELNVYKEMSEEYLRDAPERHSKSEDARIAKEIKEHEESKISYERLSKVADEVRNFLRGRLEVHREDFEKRKTEWERRLKAERQRRLEERKQKRRLDREQEAAQQKREEELRAKQQAEQDERDRIERERQETRQMHQRLREKAEMRERDHTSQAGSNRSWRTHESSDRPNGRDAGGAAADGEGSTNRWSNVRQQRQQEGFSGGERGTEQRERGPPAPPVSNDVSDWRSQMQAPAPQQPQQARGYGRRDGRESREDGRESRGPPQRENAPQPPPSQAPAAAAGGGGASKYVPPHQRRR